MLFFILNIQRGLVSSTQSLVLVRTTMDFFQHRYYRLNKTLMTLIGQWPYQSIRTRRRFLALYIILIICQVVPRILALVKYHDDWKIVLDCIIPLLGNALCIMNLINFIKNSHKTFKMLNRIRMNWEVWARDREVNILHEYAEQGEKITIFYTAVVYSSVFVFLTEPVIPKIIDVLLMNGTKPGRFPNPVDFYHLDVQKYYFYIILYSYVCECMGTMVSLTSDVMLITYVQHVCGIFAALGHKLQRIGSNDRSILKEEISHELDKRDIIYLALCVERHNDALEYAKLIEATYTWNIFFITGLGITLIISLGLQVLIRTSNPETTTRFVVLAMCIELIFFLECYISQILMDHSINTGYYIQNSQWYRLSPKVQKFLQLITMRCTVPCHLTAGKMFVVSLRSFGLTFRTTMSYFALVRSIHDS